MGGKLIVLAAILVMASPVLAASGTDASSLCKSSGYQYSVATWNWNGGSYELDLGSYDIFGGERAGYHTTVTGSASNAEWTSNRNVNGVVGVGTGDIKYAGASDLLSGTATTNGAFTKIILCANSGGKSSSEGPVDPADPVVNDQMLLNDQLEVPEFGILALLGATLVGIGLIAFRNSY